MMDETIGYIKYGFVGMISVIGYAGWQELLVTGAAALFLGFMGALGGFTSKLLTNWLKRKWDIFRTK